MPFIQINTCNLKNWWYQSYCNFLLLIYLTTFIALTINYVIAKKCRNVQFLIYSNEKKKLWEKTSIQEYFICQNKNFKIHSLFNKHVSKPLRFYDNICSILSFFKWDNPSKAYRYIPSISSYLSYLVHHIKIIQQCRIAHLFLKEVFFCLVWLSCWNFPNTTTRLIIFRAILNKGPMKSNISIG
jgi:hypothetical protein